MQWHACCDAVASTLSTRPADAAMHLNHPHHTQPKREPRPKKPRIERPAASGGQQYADDDEDFEALDLAMEDDAADEDFDFTTEVCDTGRDAAVAGGLG